MRGASEAKLATGMQALPEEAGGCRVSQLTDLFNFLPLAWQDRFRGFFEPTEKLERTTTVATGKSRGKRLKRNDVSRVTHHVPPSPPLVAPNGDAASESFSGIFKEQLRRWTDSEVLK